MENNQKNLFVKMRQFLMSTKQQLTLEGGMGKVEVNMQDVAQEFGIEESDIPNFIRLFQANVYSYGLYCWYDEPNWCFCMKNSAGLHLSNEQILHLMAQEEHQRKNFDTLFTEK
ncbi:MAG: hypothetical protein GTN82_15605 [Candidatus Aminicenantes bacterium]|nr:hypothetical protein [Candidatus Aminicenantes bacterium]